MAVGLKEKRFGTLLLVTIVGILVGSYVSELISLIPGDNVVKTFFTHHFISFGIGDFVHNKPVLIDLSAIKFQFGFQVRFNLLSILGVFLSLYFYRWYK